MYLINNYKKIISFSHHEHEKLNKSSISEYNIMYPVKIAQTAFVFDLELLNALIRQIWVLNDIYGHQINNLPTNSLQLRR